MTCRATKLLLILTALALIAWPARATAQKACAVLSNDVKPYREAVQGFKQSFKGSVDEIVMPKDPSKASEILGRISGTGCDVVLTMGSSALKFLRLRLTDKPIVFAMTLSPSAAATKGLNITGVYLEPPPNLALSTIRRILPAARRVGVMHSSSGSNYLDDARRYASGMGLELVSIPTPKISDAVRQSVNVATRCDVIWMIPDLVTSTKPVFKALLESSLRNNVPIFALAQKHVEGGALATLSTDYRANGTQAGVIANRIVAGTQARSITPEYSAKAGVILNEKTAKRLGISIPKMVVEEASQVYR